MKWNAIPKLLLGFIIIPLLIVDCVVVLLVSLSSENATLMLSLDFSSFFPCIATAGNEHKKNCRKETVLWPLANSISWISVTTGNPMNFVHLCTYAKGTNRRERTSERTKQYWLLLISCNCLQLCLHLKLCYEWLFISLTGGSVTEWSQREKKDGLLYSRRSLYE